MTRAEPGGTLAQNSWRSSKHASASGTSKRMSLDAYSMIFCTRAAHAWLWISSLRARPARLGRMLARPDDAEACVCADAQQSATHCYILLQTTNLTSTRSSPIASPLLMTTPFAVLPMAEQQGQQQRSTWPCRPAPHMLECSPNKTKRGIPYTFADKCVPRTEATQTNGRAPVVLQALDDARVFAHRAAHGVALVPAHDLHGRRQPHHRNSRFSLLVRTLALLARWHRQSSGTKAKLPPCCRKRRGEPAPSGLTQAHAAAAAQLGSALGRRAPRAAGAQGPARARLDVARAQLAQLGVQPEVGRARGHHLLQLLAAGF